MKRTALILGLSAALLGAPHAARADAIIQWNLRANALVAEAKLGTPPAIRAMALLHTAIDEAVGAAVARGASVDAAVAAASRAALARLVPGVQTSVEHAYGAALASVADGPAKAAGVALGEKAADAVFAARADDRLPAGESYRPHAAPGVYVPTATPAAVAWPQRKPWLMASAGQFRPGPPPALSSKVWVQHYNEVKSLGARAYERRSAEQAEIARFWEYSLPSIYHGVVRSVAGMAGRDARQNARLFAAVTQAMDDAMIAVFDAKYHYHFWRPSTAIRNGDLDGNDATERDAAWLPFSDAPLHPEYPSGHSILAGAVGAVLEAAVGRGPVPLLETSSPTAKGATRRWTTVDAFVREVADARVYEGIHFRFSVETATDMGRQIGRLAAARHLRAERVAAND